VADLQVDATELAQLAGQLVSAGHQLADLEAANAEAGRVVLEAARPAAPVASGQLASSLTADASANGVAWASTARYWTFVHWGAPRRNMRARPFFLQALELDTDRIVAVYADHATETLTRNLT
jgi:HK97 gp10 family phage protein